MKTEQKSVLRRVFRDKRLALSHKTRRIKANQLFEQLLEMPELHLTHIASYLPVDNEIAPPTHFDTKQKIYLPKINLITQQLDFIPYQPGDPLQTHDQYLHQEPSSCTVFPIQSLDVVLVPLVAFDNTGHRLGLGKGYYDRTFSNKSISSRKPFLLGLAYDCQHSDILPIDPWDLPLDAVVTESQTWRF